MLTSRNKKNHFLSFSSIFQQIPSKKPIHTLKTQM